MSRSQTILFGFKSTLGVVIAFIVLFLSLGALMHQEGYTFWQAFFSSALIAAAPLQTALLQLHHHLALSIVIILSLAVNFRFFLLSSALLPYLRHVPLLKILPPIQGLAASTFAVTYPDLKDGKLTHPGTFFCTVAAFNYSAVLIGTILGFALQDALASAFWRNVLVMILPLNFTILTAKLLPRWLPIIAGIMGFVLIPFVHQILPQFGILVLPLIIALVMLIWQKQREPN